MNRPIILLLFLLLASTSFAQKEGFEPITSADDFLGLWILVDSNEFINPLCDKSDPYCDMTPGGDKLIVHEDKSYFTSYIDPDFGASIDLKFTYTMTNNSLNCILTESNSIGYLMENQNQPFGLKLFISKEKSLLGMELDDGTFHQLRPMTDEDLK